MIDKFQIRNKKFYPPRFASDQCIYRINLVEKELGQRGRNKQIFFIEAQAGQGKTTLIQQYLNRYEVPFFWYQFGEEDQDPVFFLMALLVGLSRKIRDLSLPQLEQLLTSGQTSTADLSKCIDVIQKQLEDAIRKDFFIVFDDLHLLDNGGEQTLFLLRQFVSSASPHLQFFLAARRPCGIDFSQTFAMKGQFVHLKNEQIALTLDETTELFQSVFQIDIPGPFLHEIHKMTGGWAMGLVSFAHSIEQADTDVDLKRLVNMPRLKECYQDYFRQEVFDQVPDQIKSSLLILSLLDEIPVQLAESLTGRNEIGRDLAKLRARNFFIRSLDDEGSTYGMHHLFGEYLKERAKKKISKERIRRIYQVAANFFLKGQVLSVALDYLIRGEWWDDVEKLLESDGVSFIARNQTRTLALLLDKIPDDIRLCRGWMLLFSAIVVNESAVIFSLDKLEKAKNIFVKIDHRKGLLLSLSQIIWLHMASTGLFQEGRKILKQADQLFDTMREDLSIDECVMICRNIGAGALLFDFDVQSSERYLSHGIKLARDNQLWGYLNILLIFRAYTLIFEGRIKECAEEFEDIYPYFYSKQIGVTGKLSILILQMNLLEALGESELYKIRKKNIPEHLSRQQIFDFILGPYLFLWDLNLDLVSGDFARSSLLYDSKRKEIDALNPQYRSQIMKSFAYLFSLTGDSEKALFLVKEADNLRLQVGGIFFVAYHQIYVGATYAQCGLHDPARKELDQAIAALREMGNYFLLASALMQRAWLIIKINNKATNDALHDLAEALDLSASKDFGQFRSVTPVILEVLLRVAIEYDIHRGHAHNLIRNLLKKNVTEKGQLTPLLDLKFLGEILISYDGQVVCHSADVPPIQRELLALLAVMPGQKIRQEQVQVLFWPESTAMKARTNMDTLVSRLRASLGSVIPKNNLKHYISLQKGILSLRHCSIDILAFRQLVKDGLLSLSNKQAWNAENCFLKALALWEGPFAPEIFGASEQVMFYRSELLRYFTKMATCWSKTLVEMGRLNEAIDLLHTAIRYAPTDDQLVKRLYHLLHEVSFQQGAKLLSEYRKILIREGYPPEEVAKIIAQVSKDN